ncbi:pyridoxal phosphate-dependent transferase [Paraphysoderma sedebokerense]|nr:pyridoxal phosphate-dependent transferase [Paraphysoderma sedebokerense]
MKSNPSLLNLKLQFLFSKDFNLFQVLGANTNVGKTIISTLLVRGALKQSQSSGGSVHYIKPIQTGYPEDSDARHVQTFASEALTKTLYTYKDPLSPHLCAKLENRVYEDSEVLSNLVTELNSIYSEIENQNVWCFVEGAGGVNSPTISGSLQSDFYRHLRLPTILVGDPHLGGISTTISAFESLFTRGHDINTIVLHSPHPNTQTDNHVILKRYLPDDVLLCHVPPPPSKHSNPTTDKGNLLQYYKDQDQLMLGVVNQINLKRRKQIDDLKSMKERAKKHIWYPFTQHNLIKDLNVIDSATGDFYVTAAQSKSDSSVTSDIISQPQFDACASWWTQSIGHGAPKLAFAASNAAGRYGHVIFPETVHQPALELSETILKEYAPWASRVFFSDNGSTATEVALKMGLNWTLKNMYGAKTSPSGEGKRRLDVIGLKGSYHGDTIGAMDASEPNVFNDRVHWYTPKGFWFDPPTLKLKNGRYVLHDPVSETELAFGSLSEVFDSHRDSSSLASRYRTFIWESLHKQVLNGQNFGTLIMEPVLMGAGGMIFVDPLFQRCLVQVVREGSWNATNVHSSPWKGEIPVIFDEVFVGMWRLGRKSAAELLHVDPDITCFAKCLTGGLVPLGLTVSNSQIYDSFLGPSKTDALLHGHSYTGYPVACQVALESLKMMKQSPYYKRSAEGANAPSEIMRSPWENNDIVKTISELESVSGVVNLGTVLAVEIKDEAGGYASTSTASIVAELKNVEGILVRALGNIIYIMTTLFTQQETADELARRLRRVLEKHQTGNINHN